MLVQWYPGHMAKARRMLEENLKLADVIVEIVDARCPASTKNPDFEALFSQKSRLIVLNKADLAKPFMTNRWIEHFKGQGINAMEFIATNSGMKKTAIAAIENAAREKVERMRQKGVMKTVRALVVGIPNVGKSAFINCTAGSVRAKTGDKPGVTRGKQWVRISPYLELMDSPGILWPRFDNQIYAKRLAYIGSVNDDVLDYERLAFELLLELKERCPDELKLRYKQIENFDDPIIAVCKSRGLMLLGGEPDVERAARLVLDEFRGGKIARITLDTPGEVFIDGE